MQQQFWVNITAHHQFIVDLVKKIILLYFHLKRSSLPPQRAQHWMTDSERTLRLLGKPPFTNSAGFF